VGATIISDRLVTPFIDSDEIFLHGMTYGGHPVGCAVALANIEILEREDLPGRVRENEGLFLHHLQTLEDLPIVGDIRGAGYFYGIELVKDQETQGRFSQEECDRLLRDFLSHRLLELGLICRAEDKGEPVVQLAPPLIAGPEEFAEITAILRQALSEAWDFVS
jgi:adenosylmethionine-8-amino-7-oxononanoate aminotransferase